MSRVSSVRTQKDFSDLVSSLKNKNKNLYYEEDPQCDISNVRIITQFSILLKGPPNTPFENGKFRLKVKIPSNYPNESPSIKMMTPIYHPNIKEQDICLDILDNNWKPTYNLSKIFESVYYLLKNPNPKDPLSIEVNNEYVRNQEQYIKNAKEWTEKYAK